MTDQQSFTLFPAGADAAARMADFSASEVFHRLFREGMALVEETAGYLDGQGREDSKMLERSGALAYASESMRLTTRLMQAASWLLAQRAVAEGEMSAEEASDGRYRLSEDETGEELWAEGQTPPAKLIDLVARSRAIYARLKRIDESLYADASDALEPNPVESQLARLKSAFAGQ